LSKLREAKEEINLDINQIQLEYLTTLSPFVSRNLLIVYPIIFLVLSPSQTFKSSLIPSPSEVDTIFHLNLFSFLLLPSASKILTYSYIDFPWLESSTYRLHSLSHEEHNPVTGLTADILISTALIAKWGDDAFPGANDGELGFARRAEGQLGWDELAIAALKRERGRGTIGDQRTSQT
jgi:hypothetical protein